MIATCTVSTDPMTSLEDQFGEFASVWRDGISPPIHLRLLAWYDGPFPARDIVCIAELVAQSGDVSGDIGRLFGADNWRPHIVGAIALLVQAARDDVDVRPLWDAVDAGSWVSGYLVAVASVVDARFVERAKARLASGCPTRLPDYPSLAARHSAAGPETEEQRSSKLRAALLEFAPSDEVEMDASAAVELEARAAEQWLSWIMGALRSVGIQPRAR